MMAALTAAHHGIRCIMIEKGTNIATSNGARAGGPALADTDYQRKENAVVTSEQLFQHMYAFSRGTVNAGLLRRAIGSSRKVEGLFCESGVKMKLLPDSYGVGFRARHFFETGGSKRWQPLADTFIKLGGEIHFHCAADCLLINNNLLEGAEALNTHTKERVRYLAKAVVLATGGYMGSPEMMAEHFGNVQVIPLGNTLSDGSGICMAKQAGGYEDRNWGICANEFGGANHKSSKKMTFDMRYAVSGGLLVNRQGRRFVNEQLLSDHALSAGGEATLREGLFYAVLDDRMYQQLRSVSVYDFYGQPEEWYVGRYFGSYMPMQDGLSIETEIDQGWAFRGTLQELAQQAGLKCLEQTVAEYNHCCKAGVDNQFGKSAYMLKPLLNPPFYLFEYQPSAWCTFGGVKTDEFCRMLDRQEQPVPGIYVAGVDNGSCFPQPYYDNEGAALGVSLGTGIVAAEDVVRYIQNI